MKRLFDAALKKILFGAFNGLLGTKLSPAITEGVAGFVVTYYDILPIPRNNWIPPERYMESDIVFIIYTGASFYQNRAIATRDTWLSRVTHKYFFSSTPYPSLPVTVIEGA
ncbi:unnamed protein product, partial [Rotaria sordida]